MFIMIHEKMFMYINNIFVAQFIFKKIFLDVKLRDFSSVVSYTYTLKGNACANFCIALYS